MKTDQPAVIAPCPDCEYEIRFDAIPNHGERVTCPECWADLRVVSVDPLELEWATEIEEFWDDEG